MIIAFLIGCLFLGLFLAPIVLIIVRKANNKLLGRMKEIKVNLSKEGVTLVRAKELRAEAEDLELKIVKTNDINSKREATRLLENIKDLVREIQ